LQNLNHAFEGGPVPAVLLDRIFPKPLRPLRQKKEPGILAPA
jgi:hypothetical protein